MNKKILSIFLLASFSFAAVQASKECLDNPEELLASLNLRDKIAQLIICATVSNEEANKDFMKQSPYRMDKNQLEFLIKHCHIGGILFLGSGVRAEQIARTKYFQKISNIPLLVVVDAEYGSAMRLVKDGLEFPRYMTLGALTDDELIYQMGYLIGLDLQELGAHMNLAPVADVNNNPNNPVIYDRSFGSNPENVARKCVAFMKGLQAAGIDACAKHFPGHGDTTVDSHLALPTIIHTREHLNETELIPFVSCIENDIDAVMMAHISVPELDGIANVPASLSKKITTELLRNELGFDGLILTDGLGMCAATQHQPSGVLELQALLAGADLLLCPIDASLVINYLYEAVQRNVITEEAINAKVLKVLKAKQKALARQAAHQKTSYLELAEKLKKEIYLKAITQVYDKRSPDKPQIYLSVTPPSKFARENFGITAEQLQQLQNAKDAGNEVTIVIYGTPYACGIFEPYAHRILVAYEDNVHTRKAVEIISKGGFTPCGKLSIDYKVNLGNN